MRFSFVTLVTLLSTGLLGFGLVACATSTKDRSAGDGDGGTGNDKEPAAETTSIPGGDDGTAPPHALGTILLGEARVAETGDSQPLISAKFLPDAKKGKACTRQVGSCQMVETPKCTTGTVQGCASGEVCSFDDACAAKCVKACTKACGATETCVFSSSAPIEDQGMACKKKDRFDAGAIAFNGTTAALTLFPPYSVKPAGDGAPFMAKSQIRVQATGAVGAGYEAFDEKFTTTSFLQTDPPLSDLTKTAVFGSGPISLGWVPGTDTVVVTAAGPMGSARCVADDTTGKFDLGRDVINAVLGTTSSSAPSLTLSVSRERRELKKDKKISGQIAGATMPATGWLEFVTSSTESHTFASCSAGYAACGETCTNLQSDAKNCGTCGNACPASYYCSAGVCRY